MGDYSIPSFGDDMTASPGEPRAPLYKQKQAPDAERCACGHRILRDHKRTMAGGYWCWLCPDSSRCEASAGARRPES